MATGAPLVDGARVLSQAWAVAPRVVALEQQPVLPPSAGAAPSPRQGGQCCFYMPDHWVAPCLQWAAGEKYVVSSPGAAAAAAADSASASTSGGDDGPGAAVRVADDGEQYRLFVTFPTVAGAKECHTNARCLQLRRALLAYAAEVPPLLFFFTHPGTGINQIRFCANERATGVPCVHVG